MQSGRLYGTNYLCGSGAGGVVYKLTPTTVPPWTETVLHSFANSGPDIKKGYWPFGTIVMDSNGAIYGVTNYGGTGAGGVVYKLTP